MSLFAPLVPSSGHVGSRSWSFWANDVAASRFVSHAARKRIYRRLGLQISPRAHDIGARCYFHSSNIAIGARSFINDFCCFENVERIVLGDDVAVGIQVTIITSTHELGDSTRRSGAWQIAPVTVHDG